MKLRLLAVGAAAMLVGGLAVGVANPAHADDGEADLAVSLTGTTIAAGAPEKFSTLTLTNHGPNDASGVVFSYDVSDLDDSKVEFVLEGCPVDADGVAECVIVDMDSIQSGANVDLFGILSKVDGATGDAGFITVEVWHDGTDPDLSNNSVTVPVVIGESGPDLLVFAPDVHHQIDEDFVFLDDLILPGSRAMVLVLVRNFGDQSAHGIKFEITLPEHVTFTFPEDECTHAAGDSTTTCEYDFLTLTPAGEIDSGVDCDWTASCGLAGFPVEISDEAPSPASLTGGKAEAWDMQVPQLFSASSTPDLPRSLLMQGVELDVDPTDNVSHFTVFVSEIVDDDDSGQGGGVGDKLPVTGVQAGLMGLIGVSVLAAGAVLFLLARRRPSAVLKGLEE
jgi:hypothetical protein